MAFFICTAIKKKIIIDDYATSVRQSMTNGETFSPLEMKQQLPVGSDIARRLLCCNSILRFGVQRKE